MKNSIRFLSVIVIIFFGTTFAERVGFMQAVTDNEVSDKNSDKCVKVELIADSNKYELKKDNFISVVLRITNNTNERLKLRDKPIFKFERVNIKEDEKTRPVLGNYYKGFIISEKSSNSEDLFLEKGGYLDFAVNINDLELVDEMSSISIWLNIFEMLKNGEYDMHSEVFVKFSNNEKTYVKEFLSNKIIISYADGKEKIKK